MLQAQKNQLCGVPVYTIRLEQGEACTAKVSRDELCYPAIARAVFESCQVGCSVGAPK